jgi:DNA-binding transcriptional regulator YhcF (GntR family)
MPERRGRANFETLYKAVADRLAGGGYRPGDRIALKALSEDLGVSVTPLREALSRLVGRDVVTERRGEGYYLTRLDARDIADLYRLHLSCLEQAVLAAPPAVITNVSDGDVWQIFDMLVLATGDHILNGVYHYLGDRLRLVRQSERALLSDEGISAQKMHAAIAASDQVSLREGIAAFHVKRIDQASVITDLLNRRRQT